MSLLAVPEVCAELRIRRETLARWKAAGCPHVIDGTRLLFDLPAVIAWRDAQPKPGKAAAKRAKPKPSEDAEASDGQETLAAVQLRKERALAERHELFVREKRRELVSRAALREQLSTAFYQLRQRLNAIRSTIEARHGTAAAEDVETEIDRALEVLVTEWTAGVTAREEVADSGAAEVAQ